MTDERGAWYLLTGLVLGVAFGLVYAWLIAPVAYTDTPPVSLRADLKETYRLTIAYAYAATGDVERARARLSLLGDAEPGGALVAQAQQAAGRGETQSAQALTALAQALGAILPPSATPSPTRTASPTPGITPSRVVLTATRTPIPSATLTPLATFTPLPTLTPTATAGAPFVLRERKFVCDATLTRPLIQVQVFDAAGQPVPGIAALVSWEGGQARFFTGFKPELGRGYADFEMTPATKYTLRLAEGGQPIGDLSAAECESAQGGRFWGSWLLVFVQP